MSKLDPEFMRWLQRVTAIGLYIYAAGWLKLSPEILQMVGIMCGAMAGQTVAGYGQVDVQQLKKLDQALRTMPPPSNRPPP